MFDLVSNLALGFSVAAQPMNIAFCLLGALVGTLVGVLPGIGTVATVAMLLPITFGLPPVGALIMLAGIYYGAQYGGSTTSVLVNIPGEATSVVTCLDGHQMARQGRAGAALSIAAIGSFIAGCFATVLVAALGEPLTHIALLFGPAEYFALMVLGLMFAVVLAKGSVVKAITMILLGIVAHWLLKRLRRILSNRRQGSRFLEKEERRLSFSKRSHVSGRVPLNFKGISAAPSHLLIEQGVHGLVAFEPFKFDF